MHGFGDTPAGWTGIAGLRAVDVEFVGHTVLAGVRALVDVAIVANAAEQFLCALYVAFFGRADEVVVRDAHPLPEVAELGRNLIGVLLRSFAGGLRGAFDLLAVLIGAREEERVGAQQPLPPRNRIAGDRGVGVADVRPGVHVVNRSRNVELSSHMSLIRRGDRGPTEELSVYSVSSVVIAFRLSRDTPARLPASPSSGARGARPQCGGSLHTQARNW